VGPLGGLPTTARQVSSSLRPHPAISVAAGERPSTARQVSSTLARIRQLEGEWRLPFVVPPRPGFGLVQVATLPYPGYREAPSSWPTAAIQCRPLSPARATAWSSIVADRRHSGGASVPYPGYRSSILLGRRHALWAFLPYPGYRVALHHHHSSFTEIR